MRLIATARIGGYVARMHGPEAVGQFVIVGGKRAYFDFDEQFGPLVVDPLGEPMKRQPIHEHHPFWAPFEAWLKGYWTAKAAGGLDGYLDAHQGAQPRVSGVHGQRNRLSGGEG